MIMIMNLWPIIKSQTVNSHRSEFVWPVNFHASEVFAYVEMTGTMVVLILPAQVFLDAFSHLF